MLRHFVPGNEVSGPVHAEDGAGRVSYIPIRVVICEFYEFYGTGGRLIARGLESGFAVSPAVGPEFRRVVSHRCRRHLSRKDSRSPIRGKHRSGRSPAHSADIRKGPPDKGGRKAEFKGQPGLQQDVLRPHHGLPQCPEGRFPEVSGLRMLNVAFAGNQGDDYIGKRCPRQDSHQAAISGFSVQSVYDLPLVSFVQNVRRTGALNHYTGAGRAFFHRKVYLRIVAQRLIMTGSLDLSPDRLRIDDPLGAESNGHPEAALKEVLHNFLLQAAHDADVDRPVRLGRRGEPGLLLGKGRYRGTKGAVLDPVARNHPDFHGRRHEGPQRVGFGPQPLPGKGMLQATDRYDVAGQGFLHGFVLFPGVNAQLRHFFRRMLRPFSGARRIGSPRRDFIPYFQSASGDFHVREPPVRIADPEYPGGKRDVIRICGHISTTDQPL